MLPVIEILSFSSPAVSIFTLMVREPPALRETDIAGIGGKTNLKMVLSPVLKVYEKAALIPSVPKEASPRLVLITSLA